MMENLEVDKVQLPNKNDRKEYQTPVLRTFGAIAELTQAAIGDPADGGGGALVGSEL